VQVRLSSHGPVHLQEHRYHMSYCKPSSRRRDVNTHGVVPSGTCKSGVIQCLPLILPNDQLTWTFLTSGLRDLLTRTGKSSSRKLKKLISPEGPMRTMTQIQIRALQTKRTLINSKTGSLGSQKLDFPPESAKSADLHPKSEKFDYTCNTGMKIFELLVVIPVTLLSPQVRFKKTPLGF
jgi:hypothetical protein